jgi:predicted dehydrogenase
VTRTNGAAEKVRIAVVGCGGMGRRHSQLLGAVPGAEVALLVDPVPAAIERLRQTNHLEHVPSTSDPDAAFGDQAIDAVVIATHHDLHPPLAIGAARAGKHVFVEKPLALTVEACREIEAAVAQGGVQCVVGFQARHSPFVQKAHQAIPRPRVLMGQMIDPRWGDASWAQDIVTGGGNVLSQGVHTFDLLSYLAGSEPVAVHAEGGTVTHDPATTEVIDSVVATIRFANGAVASVTVGDFGPSPRVGKAFYQLFDAAGRSATVYGYYEGVLIAEGKHLTDYGPGGVARGEYTGMGHRAQLGPREPDTSHLSELEEADPLGQLGYVGELAEFVACARENTPPTIAAGVRDGTRATRLALACFESIRTRRTVEL